jgi:SAM-dependent methyltransferase
MPGSALKHPAGGLSGWDATHPDPLGESIWACVPFVKQAADAFAVGPRGTVLEVPIGGGITTGYLAQRLPFVVGVDASPHAVELARTALERGGYRNCTLMDGDVNALPFADSQFAGVFCADLLGHLRRPDRALRELMRVCRPGGTAVFNFFTPGDSTRLGPEMEELDDGAYLYRGEIYYRYFDLDAVQDVLTAAGVRPKSIEKVAWQEDPHPGFRDYPHGHETWLVIAQKEVAR